MGKASGSQPSKPRVVATAAKLRHGAVKATARASHAAAVSASPQGVRAKPGQVLKCAKCSALSSQKRWFQTEQVADKRGHQIEQAVGPSCHDCGSLHAEGFSHLEFEEFCEKGEAELKSAVEQASKVLGGDKPAFPASSVASFSRAFLELRNPVQVLNSKELKKALNVTRLPKHMRSIPKIKVPKKSMVKKGAKQKRASGKANDEEDSDAGFETLFCFADPQQPYRTGSLVQVFGAGSTSDQMPKQLWDGQAAAVLQQVVAQQAADMRTEVIMDGRQLQTLDEFLDQKRQSPRKTGSRPGFTQFVSGEASPAREEQQASEDSGEEAADTADEGCEASEEEGSAGPETQEDEEMLRAAAKACRGSQHQLSGGAPDAFKSPAKSLASGHAGKSHCAGSARSVGDSRMSEEDAELEGD
jgi:hypothetical protein